jgi:6-phosphogluconate dehydrogenase
MSNSTQAMAQSNTALSKQCCEIGIVGLGVMGRNLLLNMADHGFTVAGYDKDPNQVKSLREEAAKHTIHDTNDIKTFIALLRRPRAVLLLVPAGSIVDAVIADLLPYLEPDDLIIDAGNSYFKDTDARTESLKKKGIQFLGLGISGGEEGARLGPSIMPGGLKESYDRIHAVLEAVSAKVSGEPCVTYLGEGSCGHYVKMVHNGIEYGIMQLIAETYDVMKRALGFNNDQLRDVYEEWNKQELNSYLIEITRNIFNKIDDKTNKQLIDSISDVAKQNGTGMWTTQSAMALQVPAPTIDVAVTLRDLSALVEERRALSTVYSSPIPKLIDNPADSKQLLSCLRQGLLVGMITVYAQGMALLQVASQAYHYNLDLEAISRIWRGGCIIRAKLLEDIRIAFQAKNDLSNLLLAPNLALLVKENQIGLRKMVSTAAEIGIPMPGMMASLGYLDAFRSQNLPSNLIQAQRDYFGSHHYERIDRKGSFHTEWEKK